MERVALAGLCVQKILFLYGSGGDGKGALTTLRKSVWGAHHAAVDCAVFQTEEEFRKQLCEFRGRAFCTITEAKDNKPVESDILKGASTTPKSLPVLTMGRRVCCASAAVSGCGS